MGRMGILLAVLFAASCSAGRGVGKGGAGVGGEGTPAGEHQIIMLDGSGEGWSNETMALLKGAVNAFPFALGSQGKLPGDYLAADLAVLVAISAIARGWGAPPDAPFISDVVKADAAGFLPEYLVTFYFNPRWKLPRKKPLRLTEFAKWKEENIVDNAPPAFATILDSTGKVENAQPREFEVDPDWVEVKEASDAVMTGFDCASYLPVLRRVVDGWPPATRGGGRPVSAHFEDYLAFVEQTACEGIVRGFPELVSPSFFVAAYTLEKCAAREGGDRDRWAAMAKQMNPAGAYNLDEAIRRIKEGQSKGETICPGPETDVNEAICLAKRPEMYGFSSLKPLEIGLAAGGETLWYGRLLCPNRSTPLVRRLGAVGPPQAESKAPLSPIGGQGVEELVQWSVSCPGIDEPFILYTNMYRCGLNCPPMHFHVLSAHAYRRYLRSLHLEEMGKFREAVLELEALPDDQLHTEIVLTQVGKLYVEQMEADNARTYLDAALKLNPDSPRLRLLRARVEELEGKMENYLDALEQLLLDVSPGDPLYPEVVCRKGLALEEMGRTAQALPLLDEACTLGQEECCIRK